MNSHESLNRMIDEQRKGRAVVPTTEDEAFAVDLLKWADHLTPTADLDARVMRGLREDTSRISAHRKPAPMLRFAAVIAAAVLGFGVLVMTVPPLRTLAQSILYQFGLLTVTDAPTGYDEWLAQPTVDPASTPIPGIEPQVYEMRNLSLEAVEALTGFPVLEPRDVPTGYLRGSRDVWQRNGMNSASTSYYSPHSPISFNIAQTLYDESMPHAFSIGDAPTQAVEVRGVSGLWVEHSATWPPGSTLSMLFWQEGEFTFILQSGTTTGSPFGLAEMLRIANSLE
ncbi:MAG: hypothetical protein U0670_12875 [Anaerolineae bacterium]